MDDTKKIEFINELKEYIKSKKSYKTILDYLWFYGDQNDDENTFEKKLYRIENSKTIRYPSLYAKNRIEKTGDSILLYYDSSLVKNGKSGFAFTSQYLYNLTNYSKVLLSEITSVKVFSEKGDYYLVIENKNGDVWEFYDNSGSFSRDKNVFKAFEDVINKFIDKYAQEQNDLKLEKRTIKLKEQSRNEKAQEQNDSGLENKESLGQERNNLELEKRAKELVEKAKIEKERIEKERFDKQNKEQEIENKENLEQEQNDFEIEKRAKDLIEKAKIEKERIDRERIAKEQQEKEREERERVAREQQEKEREERERAAKEQQEKERIEKERKEEEQREQARLEKERIERNNKEIENRKKVAIDYARNELIIPANDIALTREVLLRVFNRFCDKSYIVKKYLYEFDDRSFNGIFSKEKNKGQFVIYCKDSMILTDQRVYFLGAESYCFYLKDIIEMVPMYNAADSNSAILFGFTNRTTSLKNIYVNSIVAELYCINVSLGIIESLKGNRPLGYYYIPSNSGQNSSFLYCNNKKMMTTMPINNQGAICNVCSDSSLYNHYKVMQYDKLGNVTSGMRDIFCQSIQDILLNVYNNDEKIGGLLKEYQKIEDDKKRKQYIINISNQLIAGTQLQKFYHYSYIEEITNPNMREALQYQLNNFPGQFLLYWDGVVYISDKFFGWDWVFKPLNDLAEIRWEPYSSKNRDYKDYKDKSMLVILKNGEKYRVRDFGIRGKYLAEWLNAIIGKEGALEKANEIKRRNRIQ